MMIKSWALPLLVLASTAAAQAPIEYSLTFDNADHREARVSVVWRGIGPEPLEVRISHSSPGRYALHEFARNIYDVRFTDGRGRTLAATRTDPYGWTVAGHDGTVVAGYTVYGARVDGTYTAIDSTHAHLNMPATFVWARGLDARPIKVEFAPRPGWRVATQLVPTDDQNAFTAPDLQYFMDSPTELSDFDERTWDVDSNGRRQTFHLIVHHGGDAAAVDSLLEKLQRVVAAETEIFGELPAFDHGEYRFIADYADGADDDGMEHRNSTIITEPDPLDPAKFREQLGAYSHEFLHIWNVERARPAELEPFDFERANMTPSLWFAEGFTSYYDTLVLRRIGELTVADYADVLADLVNGVTLAPGRRFTSPIGMSLEAPLFDGASSPSPSNATNSFLSYYNYGAAIALALDLSLRERFDATLDALMRLVWQRHGIDEAPYTTDDLLTALADVTGDRAFADEFFARYIAGNELPDYAKLLAGAGLLLRPTEPGAASLGDVSLEFGDGAAEIVRNTLAGTPLYEAGLDRGDRILTLAGRRIRTRRGWERAVGRFEPGESATLGFVRGEETLEARVTFRADPRNELVTFEAAGRELPAGALLLRTQWLGDD